MNPGAGIHWLSVVLVSLAMLAASTLPADETAPSLKEAFSPHFQVGTALNRSHVTGSGGRRSADQVAQEVALVKHQFNQITAENDMKWQLIHPREGADGYDFGPADALVNFGRSNRMEVVGHTLVWHSQIPNWVFANANAATTQGGLVRDADQKLATADAGVFRAFLKHRDAVKRVTFWGVNDAVSWRAQGKPLLFDGDNQPKPAFDAVMAEGGKAAVAD